MSAIIIDGKQIALNENQTEYTYQTTQTAANVKATSTDPNANITVIGNNSIKDGSIIQVIVTAEDGVTTGEYKINVFINSNVVKAQTENKLPALVLLGVLTVAAIIIAGMLIKKHKN